MAWGDSQQKGVALRGLRRNRGGCTLFLRRHTAIARARFYGPRFAQAQTTAQTTQRAHKVPNALLRRRAFKPRRARRVSQSNSREANSLMGYGDRATS